MCTGNLSEISEESFGAGQDVVRRDTVALWPDPRHEETVKTDRGNMIAIIIPNRAAISTSNLPDLGETSRICSRYKKLRSFV
jgi:hypothetical protein